MPVFKEVVKRVRDWKVNSVGSTYTRYFKSAEDKAKVMANYARYYGPGILEVGTGAAALVASRTVFGGILANPRSLENIGKVVGGMGKVSVGSGLIEKGVKDIRAAGGKMRAAADAKSAAADVKKHMEKPLYEWVPDN